MLAPLLTLLAGAFMASAYWSYFASARSAAIRPNPWSWGLWGVTTLAEAATYDATNDAGWPNVVFYGSSACCFAVTLVVWRGGARERPTPVEWFCVAATTGSLLTWLRFGDAWWAHLVTVIAVPISFVPSWLDGWKEPRRERGAPWLCWSIADLLVLALVLFGPSNDLRELLYVVVELACHATTWLVVVRANACAGALRIETTHLGKGVFAGRPFARGERIIRFTGPRLHHSELPSGYHGERDRYVQVDLECFMGPSGDADDLINHSCEPNAGLRFLDDEIWLVAIEAIPTGQEVTWDYSTTLFRNPWQMRCLCGKGSCRGTIGEFAGLAPALQAKYRQLDIVPPYLAEQSTRPRTLDGSGHEARLAERKGSAGFSSVESRAAEGRPNQCAAFAGVPARRPSCALGRRPERGPGW